jgi:LDH2 family malate/lactate/ureidoglycolate dehydrogenase
MKKVPLAEGFEDVFYPGEIEARNDIENRRKGLLLPGDTLRDLEKLASDLGLAASLPF